MKLLLRPYQEELIKKVRQEFKNGKKSVCAILGCGGGKSVIAANVAKLATQKGNRVLFLVHRRELCQQIADTFQNVGVNMDLCQISMVQTVTRRLAKTPYPQLIITDECHHALSDTYKRIYGYFGDAVHLGFTATPARMNEGGLGAVFQVLVESVSTKWLIANNFLAPYEYYSAKLASADDVAVKRGDYDSKALAALMEHKVIYGKTVENWSKIAKGKQTVIYCASIAASEATAKEFKAAGFSAYSLSGETPSHVRAEVVEKFRAGEIQILCNVDLFGEGFDVPDCECVVLLRPTKSLTLYVQQSMRSMRYKKGKTAIIIDHVGNIFEHDFPDTQRTWSLKTNKKKKSNKVTVKECPVCYYCMPLSLKKCPACNYEFTKKELAETEIVDVELKKLERKEVLATKPYDYYKKIKDFEELALFQKAKKYKFAWTLHKALELNIAIPSKYHVAMRYM